MHVSVTRSLLGHEFDIQGSRSSELNGPCIGDIGQSERWWAGINKSNCNVLLQDIDRLAAFRPPGVVEAFEKTPTGKVTLVTTYETRPILPNA